MNTVTNTVNPAAATSQNNVLERTRVDGPYAKFVLGLLVVMMVFNFIDRQILAILAEDIKADLGLSDGDLGFLFGTAFAVFYAVFGIPLGRLADTWRRNRLISLSVGFWSLMTAFSGLAKGFVPLALCRFGVGVGEAGASPTAYSLLYDYFSPKVRTTVLGIYGSGVSIGVGIGLGLGGAILGAWNNAWPDPSLAPFGLKGWQVAFMIVGLPGVLLAIVLATIKEPRRGQAEGLDTAEDRVIEEDAPVNHPVRTLFLEILPMIPVVNLGVLRREGASNKALLVNVAVSIGIVLLAWGLIVLTGELLQWTALGIGLYCAFSWVQVLISRDPVCFALIFRCKTVCCLYAYNSLTAFCIVGLGFWTIPWLQRHFGASVEDVGLATGIIYAIAGLTGMILGGVVADRLRLRFQRGKLYVVLGGVLIWGIGKVAMLLSGDIVTAYFWIFVSTLLGSMAAAPLASTVTDLMLPRTRAIALSLYIMMMNFIGIALGPYCVGLVSDAFVATGVANGEALRSSMMLSMIIVVFALIFLLIAFKHIVNDENSRLERARALGESI